ncbi:MAG: peptidoglycan DD-metalloendopeptidase family protein [Gammaproteobacteria bacterium]|nr:peptidoglycan DD-metalloendopeptidase family protein [Gammaproteobacteria bacterium]
MRSARTAKSYRSRLKNLMLSIGLAMIAISVLPIPLLGSASPKVPSMPLEISSSGLPLDGDSPGGDVLSHLALSSHIDKAAQPNKSKQKPDSETAQESLPTVGKATVRKTTVVEGDSLSVIFNRLGLPLTQLYNILDAGGNARQLKHLKPGQALHFEIGDKQIVKRIRHQLDDTTILEVALDKDGKGYQSKTITEPLERRTVVAMGAIDQSLFLSGQRAGLSDKIIMELVGIFAWDVDFALDVRSGDRFAVVYEQLYKKGEKVRDGNILAAEFVNQERVFRAVQYENGKGVIDYYTPDGHNMEKLFLRTPVAFTRISSRFQRRRWHPVLHKFRAHRGVDYAAPRGTPVKVTGSGKITFVGRKGGLGQVIFVKHGRKYTTVYGHMDKYAKGMKRGQSVRQGQLIGYVGSTGLATGPHLHYEFRVNGVHTDPLTVKLPQAESISKNYRADFKNKTKRFIAQLDVLSRTMLALQPVKPKPKSKGKS